MNKYTANYTYSNPNFVIDNLVTNQLNEELAPTLFVLKNILQRGFPTILSKYLQSKLGDIHNFKNFEDRFLFIGTKYSDWRNTIKGDNNRNYFPALEFYNSISKEWGEFSYLQSLILPEVEINEITKENNEIFINQKVDFYIPQFRLVIEIDGQQHKLNDIIRVGDKERDKHLLKFNVKTIRIPTNELKNELIKEDIFNHILQKKSRHLFYKEFYEKSKEWSFTNEELNSKILPTAIIRFQILLIELLSFNYLNFEEDWDLCVYTDFEYGDFINLAIDDIFIWIKNLWKLKNKEELIQPKVKIHLSPDNQFSEYKNSIKINFSLFERYSDDHSNQPEIIFVRTDYFDVVDDKNYFQVSTCQPINYSINEDDKSTLEFFLNNIFNHKEFREGQFPIVANILQKRDTIGLLPTGGGKSICYQLPCLLQPSINFVVCPIKSLMYDQNENLKNTLVTNVNFITSDLSSEKRERVELDFEKGKYLLIWISPERFQKESFRMKINSILSSKSISYAVIDEVHCISEWGHDFRTSYLNLTKTIDSFSSNSNNPINFIGLTATASVNVLKDIKIEFSRKNKFFDDSNVISLSNFSRKELKFKVINDHGNKRNVLYNLINELKDSDHLLESDKKSCLIFTPNVNGNSGCFDIANALNSQFSTEVGFFAGSFPNTKFTDENGNKISMPIMSEKEFDVYKLQVQKQFKENKINILVATKAFGMGIDNPNIHFTIHYGFPNSVESFYQEAGRAGRWNKNENTENQYAKCFILYSPETCKPELYEKIFEPNTTFEEIKKIIEEVKFAGQDGFKQLFLFVHNQNDIPKDFELIKTFYELYFVQNTKVTIYFNDVRTKLNCDDKIIEKIIYRLSLLGIVNDWTTDFTTHYEVYFNQSDDDHLKSSLRNYISKYDKTFNLDEELSRISKDTILEKCSWLLLNWIFKTIIYNRKQSLKNISEFCSKFDENGGCENFKKRVENYFIFSEISFKFQDIAENPWKLSQWFDGLYKYENYQNGKDTISTKTFIPDIIDILEKKSEFEKLRDTLGRFLESFNQNPGLNFLSGFIRLSLNDFENSDGRNRFENSLSNISENVSGFDLDYFLNRLIKMGNNLDENQKFELSQSILKYFPERREELADYYNLPYLFEEFYLNGINKIREIKLKIYEQIREI